MPEAPDPVFPGLGTIFEEPLWDIAGSEHDLIINCCLNALNVIQIAKIGFLSLNNAWSFFSRMFKKKPGTACHCCWSKVWEFYRSPCPVQETFSVPVRRKLWEIHSPIEFLTVDMCYLILNCDSLKHFHFLCGNWSEKIRVWSTVWWYPWPVTTKQGGGGQDWVT